MEGGLRVWITETAPGTLTLRAVYRRAWLERFPIAGFLQDFVCVLEQAVRDPGCSVTALTARMEAGRRPEIS
jgi:hypothetical protein